MTQNFFYPSLEHVLNAEDKLIVVDGGARNGPVDMVGLHGLCQYHCFEPNPIELSSATWEIKNQVKDEAKREQTSVYPYALCGWSGTATLNISIRPGSTSTLEPNQELLGRFAVDNFSEMREIVERLEVPAISLADFMQQASLNHIDFIKLDTQGNELDILKSAGSFLQTTSVIMTEVEMIPLYKDQALFHDVTAFLSSQGFELVDLRSNPTCRRFHARDDLPPSAYRMVWGDAFYARQLDDASKPRSLQQGLVLAGLGYADIAIDLFQRNPAMSKKQKFDLEKFARWAAEPHWATGRIRRFFERTFGLLIQRYHWRDGHQVVSRKR